MISVCFVCLGNICRSPTAEGVMLKKLKDHNLQDAIVIDSAGTSAYHVGERADARSRECAQKREAMNTESSSTIYEARF